MKVSIFSKNSQPNETTIILVRHGQSTSNLKGVHQGRSDHSVLTQKGRDSAYLTGLALQDIKIDAIYSSPLKRTQETAHEILAALSETGAHLPSLKLSQNLKEVDLPMWEGLAYKTVREKFPQDYQCWQERPHEFRMEIPLQEVHYSTGNLAVCSPPNLYFFPVLDLFKEAESFLEEILLHHRGQTILVVSHGGKNRALISTALGISASHFQRMQQSNCGISVLKFQSNSPKQGQFVALNLTSHVDEKVPKLKAGKTGLRLILVSSSTTQTQHIQNMTEQLKSVKLDFSLVQGLNPAQTVADQILQPHSTTLQFQVKPESLLHVWPQKIQHRFQVSGEKNIENQLLTGLVVVDDMTIKSFLGQSLNLSSHQLED